MKNFYICIRLSLLLFILSISSAEASDVTISGSAYFKCSFNSKYLEKHGYSYIQEVFYINGFKTNIFGAKDAAVTITNKNKKVLGEGVTDKRGDFSVSVPADTIYKVILQFHDRKVEYEIADSADKNVTADLGYFDTETVGSWLQIPPLSYCYTCGLRYLETNGSY